MLPPRLPIVLVFTLALLTLGSAASDVGAATVRVLARPAVSLQANAQGALVEVSGTVRDPVGRPLVSLPVQIEWSDAAGNTTTGAAETDGAGQFQIRRILPNGDWQIAARFPGNAYLTPAESAVSLRSERAPLDLRCNAPRFVAHDAPEITIGCDAFLDGVPWTATPIELRSDCASVVPSDDGSGEAPRMWWIEPRAVGACRVTASAPSSEVHAGGTFVHDLRFVERVGIEWSAEPAPLQRVLGPRYVLRGRLQDAAGPLIGAQVDVVSGGIATRSETDADGRFVASVDLSGLAVGRYAADAAFRSDLPADTVLAVAPSLELLRLRGVSEIVIVLGVLLLGLVAALLSWAIRPGRALLRRARRRAPPVAVPPTDPLPAPEPTSAFVVVVDASNGKRVAGAEVRVFVGAGPDVLAHERGPDLRLDATPTACRIEARAPGYRTVELRDASLVGGSRIVIRLTPVRIHVRDQVHSLLDDLELRSADLRWGRATVAAMRSALRGGLRALRRDRAPERVVSLELDRLLLLAESTPPDAVAAAEALVLVLDRVWWQPDPSEADAALADLLVTRVRAAAAGRG